MIVMLDGNLGCVPADLTHTTLQIALGFLSAQVIIVITIDAVSIALTIHAILIMLKTLSHTRAVIRIIYHLLVILNVRLQVL